MPLILPKSLFSSLLRPASNPHQLTCRRAKTYWTTGRLEKVNSSLEQICETIASSGQIVVMAGAGLSTASGIPDFRSPTSGLYTNLSRYNLPYPEAIFEIDYFRRNPVPFNTWAKELLPGINYLPNKGHYFLKLLEEKGKLAACFTQNVDGLERLAGIPDEKLVEAHGSFSSCSCSSCGQEADLATLRHNILNAITTRCTHCNGFVKPDIVFFGENLPERFFREAETSCLLSDLLICLGTSLEVYPFAGVVDAPHHQTPRLLINHNLVGSIGARPHDFALLGDIVQHTEQICTRLGWSEDILEIQIENELKIMKEQTEE